MAVWPADDKIIRNDLKTEMMVFYICLSHVIKVRVFPFGSSSCVANELGLH